MIKKELAQKIAIFCAVFIPTFSNLPRKKGAHVKKGSSVMKTKLSRALLGLALAVSAALLAACGGGGGESVTAPNGDSITITAITPSTASTVSTTQTLTVDYASTPVLSSANASLICGTTTVAVTSAITPSRVTFTPSAPMPSASTCNGTVTLAAGSVTRIGTVMFQTEASAPTVFRYTDLVIAIDAGTTKNLSVIGDTGSISVGGTTRGCEVYLDSSNAVAKASDGQPMFECQSAAAGPRKVYVLHPTNHTLSEYTGVVPSGITKVSVPFGTFGSSPYNSCGVTSPNGMAVEKGGNLFYITGTSFQLKKVSEGTAAATSCSGATSLAGQVQFIAKVSN